ncbi:putative immunity protein [Nocardioides sp. NPDC051685]|uniref:putative immunity protein n=1 Tax=Nocardioides sp. NPDC051685 TaxID=3364334 RepID=UPI00378BAA8D
MILAKERDPRLITLRRGGTLTDADHHLLALWAATCAEHVLHLFESECPDDPRPREAIEAARAWTRGELKMMEARTLGGHAMGAARPLRGAARNAAYAAGQAGVVAHVAAHDLGAAAYAIKAVRDAAPPGRAPGVPLAAGAAPGPRPRARPRRPADPQRHLLGGLRMSDRDR